MAVDFKDLVSRPVRTPVRLRPAARRVQTPAVPAPVKVVDAVLAPQPVVDLTDAALARPRPAVSSADVPATSYWVRRRREAEASDQA